MSWIRFALAVVGAGFASTFTDWLFAGDWIHRRFNYPEIWRQGKEKRAIALSTPLPFLTCAVFVYLSSRLGLRSAGAAKLALAIWLIGPLPLILTNAAFIKLHRVFVLSYSIGWLVKLLIAALAVGSLVP